MVRVFPSADTTLVPVSTTFPAFLRVTSRVLAFTRLKDCVSKLGLPVVG